MGKHKKKSTKRAKKQQPGRADDRVAGWERISRRSAKGGTGPPWLHAKRPVLRFVAIFGVCMGAFYALTVSSFFAEVGWDPYLKLNAEMCGKILRVLGQEVTVSGYRISSPQASLLIAGGCDAIHPSALFVSAVLALPVSLWAKLPGLVVGTLFLMMTNLIRIISLFYVQLHFPQAFEIMHIEVWQALFIFLAILCWVIWARWAIGGRVARPDVAT